MPLTQTKKNFVRSLLRHIERVARASGSSETLWFCAKFFYLPQEVGGQDDNFHPRSKGGEVHRMMISQTGEGKP